MEFIRREDIPALSNPGVVSRQLLNPDSAPEARVTLTEVRLEPGERQPRHCHESSEQIWYAVLGSGTLLLGDGREAPFRIGDVVRFAPGETHGLFNGGESDFVYISVTSPPLRFDAAYRDRL
jgi:mannose-6-phosphate isomerase-like protein (cupin superfamily)